MAKFRQLMESLRSAEYRRAFAEDVGTGLATQIKLLREKFGWTQEELAQRTGKKQTMISQWENPNYGRYTLNTLEELAAAFDVALIVKFAPFSELVDWTANLTMQRLAPPSFEEEAGVDTQLSLGDLPFATATGWTAVAAGALDTEVIHPQKMAFGILGETVDWTAAWTAKRSATEKDFALAS